MDWFVITSGLMPTQTDDYWSSHSSTDSHNRPTDRNRFECVIEYWMLLVASSIVCYCWKVTGIWRPERERRRLAFPLELRLLFVFGSWLVGVSLLSQADAPTDIQQTSQQQISMMSDKVVAVWWKCCLTHRWPADRHQQKQNNDSISLMQQTQSACLSLENKRTEQKTKRKRRRRAKEKNFCLLLHNKRLCVSSIRSSCNNDSVI